MGISVRSGGGRGRGREVNLGDRLPIQHEEGARIGGGLAALIFGGIFVTPIPVLLAQASGAKPMPLSAYAIGGVFLLIGCGIMALGVGGFRHKVSIRIDAGGVRGLRRGLMGTRRWHDSLNAYRGVLSEEQYHSGGKNHNSYTDYKVVLKHHSESDRDVLLYSSRSPHKHRAQAERFAALIARPMLVEAADGSYVEREVADLDKSVHELVAEGKLEAQFDPYAMPQNNKLTLRQQGDGYVFEHHYRSAAFRFMGPVFACVGVGLLYWYYGPGLPETSEGDPWVVVAVGAVFSLVGSFATLFCLFATSTLHLIPRELHRYTTLFGRRLSDTRLSSHAIEEVVVRKDKQGNVALHVSGDTGSLKFGTQALQSEELEYVRDGVIAVLGR